MTALISEVDSSFAFGPFLLIPEQQLLLEDEKPVRISRRAFYLLTALVQNHGQVVSKRELLSRAWPGRVVEEGNLKVNIAAIRRLLGEGPSPPRYIATVVGRGYRFIETVRYASHLDPKALHPTPPRRAGNLPPSTKRIFGREHAIRSILQDLENTRLVSIVGPGGVGKTTVALAVADSAAGSLKGGAWLVDLSLLDQQSKVPQAIADVMRSSTRKADDKAVEPSELLRDREMLLVLDNCEHLIGAVATCADQLLASTRNVKLVTTSREPLCIRGERVRRLTGLGLPPTMAGIKAREALDFPSVQLFADRAAEKFKAFRLDDVNAPKVAAICHRLDGHALAIERVAQRVGALSIERMLDHLDRRFHMFDGYHEGPERHRTLTANVNASYTLLSPSEQAVMRRLSIFAGGFSLESACAIGGAQDIDRETVVESIASLVAKSLLLAELRNGEMRYSQAHVTRAFAIEKLNEHGELENVRRHADHLTELFGNADGRAG
ncbi:winged helix-turn-helix domain-containing protein [Variovorax sp. J22P168]|uniref:ATP-binding protein n=1 Tax=Variovorax jilinensis TaxID=3053513 RepID=UPI002576A2F6|nr:winged helix-turn-helix domain-containing protein [Variovorax sp. J22P168]MDM0015315.1 winged helix-turn-helix domain-containing protein [Variovorax sp. J22P168]